MRLEPATVDDTPAILALLADCELPTADWSPALTAASLVLRDASGLAGVGAVEPLGEAGLLRSVAVAPRARATGWGRRIVEALEARSRAQGLRALYLLTTTQAIISSDWATACWHARTPPRRSAPPHSSARCARLPPR